MITLPKVDLEKLINDIAAIAGDSPFKVTQTISINNSGMLVVSLASESNFTTMFRIERPTVETLLEAIKGNLQQVYFQLNTNTAKVNGRRARDRVQMAATLFKEIIPDGELSAFKDGDFIFCRLIAKDDVKKLEEALLKHGWSFGKRQPEHDGHGNEIKNTGGMHWTMKGQNMKLPENQDKASFSVRIAPVPTMWKILNQNGRDWFEFWFDEFSS